MVVECYILSNPKIRSYTKHKFQCKNKYLTQKRHVLGIRTVPIDQGNTVLWNKWMTEVREWKKREEDIWRWWSSYWWLVNKNDNIEEEMTDYLSLEKHEESDSFEGIRVLMIEELITVIEGSYWNKLEKLIKFKVDLKLLVIQVLMSYFMQKQLLLPIC